jgi:Mce-associated membrane protein
MSDDKTPKRPVRGSRPSSSAPRKIAGAGRSTRPEMPPVEGPAAPEAATPPPPPTELPATAAAAAEPTFVIQGDTEAAEPATGVLSQRRTTVVLAGLLAGLLAVVAVLAGFVVDDEGGWYGVGDDEGSAGEAWEYDAGEPFDLPDQPISVPFVDARNAGEAATNAVVAILTVNWKTYDEHFEDVQSRMTEEFAADYADEVEDTRERFIASKADYQFEVAGQSVISATEDEVTALLFLNQYVFKGAGADRTGPEVYQVRVVVTAVPDGDEWLVQELEAL